MTALALRSGSMIPTTLLVMALAVPVPKALTKDNDIPVTSVYATAGMGGPTWVLDEKGYRKVDLPKPMAVRAEKDVKEALKVVEDVARKNEPTAFLVAGHDIADAITTTKEVYGGGKGSDTLVRHPTKNGGDTWVCACLGTNSSTPPVFVLKKVEVDGSTVRITCRRPPNFAQTTDSVCYMLWANLKQLKPGEYTLEVMVIDAEQKKREPLVSRTVTVEK